MAEFNGSSTLSRSVAQLLETSEDPAAIAALLPGCEALHRTDAEHIEGRLATEVAGIPVTAAVSVLVSLLVARLLTPMMAAYFMKATSHHEHDGAIMRRYIENRPAAAPSTTVQDRPRGFGKRGL